MLSPWVSLAELVEKFLSARAKGRESLRVFINTSLAEGWEERGARMDPHPLYARREDYGEDIEVPATAVCLTAGVDVQADRFDVVVYGWGPAGERWLVDWRSIPGDPKKPETRAALFEALKRPYAHELKVSLPILATCIDSGYATDEIYEFVLANQHRRIYATKGIAGRSGEPIVGKPSDKRYGRAPRPVRLYPINVDDAKGEIIANLALPGAGSGLPGAGPGYIHFPNRLDNVDEEFFAQLCAEHRETVYSKGGIATHFVWVQDRERNEALDCTVLALAAFKLLNPNLRDMAERIRQAAPAGRDADGGIPPAPGPAQAKASAKPRRSARSTYLQR
jgi:phage terminase large subunit GpA-like protein